MEFEENSGDKAPIWRHFLRAKDKSTAKCKHCNKIYKISGGSTGALHKHMKNSHRANLDSEQSNAQSASTSSAAGTSNVQLDSDQHDPDSEQPPARKKVKLTDFYESEENPSTETLISKMIALDGIPFRTLTNSDSLRQVFKKAGHPIPKSPQAIRDLIFKQYDQKKEDLKKEIQKHVANHVKFAISFDEWTSNRNRRYISLNLHSPCLNGPFKFKNLGLIRVYGSLPARKCIQQISDKLLTYGLRLEKDIVGVTTDGCSMMVKIGKILNSLHQQCIAHAIQLALADVFYKKWNATDTEDIEVVVEEQYFDFDDETPLAELARRSQTSHDAPGEPGTCEVNTDAEDENDIDGVEFVEDTINFGHTNQSEFRFHALLAKVRTVVKLFKRSPTKNDDILQKYVKSEFGKEYPLVLDAKTRWSSIEGMLARFLKLKLPITKSLLDLNSDIAFTQDEWDAMHEVHEILDITKAVVESLCRRDASLFTADIAIKFALKKLGQMNSQISKEMENALKKRYLQRRLVEASTLNYLTNPDQYFENIENEDLAVFFRPTSDEMCQGIVKLVEQGSNEENRDISECDPNPSDEVQNVDEGVSAITNTDELNIELRKAQAITQQNRRRRETDCDLFMTVKIEMTLFENGGSRGHNLSLAFKHLSAIPPTSVEPERIFSSAGFICNRLRTCLSDESLDAISYLRSFYLERKR